MEKYCNRYPDSEQKAIEHYHSNIELSESFYSILSIFEVAFRNSLNRELTEYFGAKDWYLKVDQGRITRYCRKRPATRHQTQ